MNEVRIGIVGVANMGLQHARYIANGEISGTRLTAVCATKQSTIDRAKSVLPDDVQGFTDYDTFLKSGLLDAVMIVTPQFLHPEMAVKAFEKGFHVLIEKPAGVYTEHVLPMNEAAKKSGKVFSIMYNERANPAFIRLREMIQSGETEKIRRIVWIDTLSYRTDAYFESLPWHRTYASDGGGVLLNQTIHSLDIWQWLFGMPATVQAFCEFGKYHPSIEVEDEATAYMTYENGAIGSYIASTGDAPGTGRLEVTCDAGKIVVEGNILRFHKLEQTEREFNAVNKNPFGTPKVTVITTEFPKPDGMLHSRVTQNFVDVILHGAPNGWSGESGINSLELANAMILSSWEGNKTIPLPIDGKRYRSLLEEKVGRPLE